MNSKLVESPLEQTEESMFTTESLLNDQCCPDGPPMIRKAIDFIHRHKSQDISLDQVAEEVNASTFYLCRKFKKSTGLNYTQYLSRLRIENAKSLLADPNLRISEIAYDVGFQSHTHFNRIFKKLIGLSPREYRSHQSDD